VNKGFAPLTNPLHLPPNFGGRGRGVEGLAHRVTSTPIHVLTLNKGKEADLDF